MRAVHATAVLFLLLPLIASAQATPGPALSVDVSANRHPISPGVYGINWDWDKETDSQQNIAAAAAAGATIRRWGGNNTSRYHWKFDVMNIDADWFFEVLPDSKVDASKLPEGSSFNTSFERWRASGAQVMGTVPILDWLPKARARMCSFSVAKYGKQCTYDPYWNDCGTGILYQTSCPTPSPANPANGYSPSNAKYIQNDPTDANAKFDESLQHEWIQYLVGKYGAGNKGGVMYWSLDNEPDWWQSTHRDIHPSAETYDETFQNGIRYARAIKDADPTALVTGPVVSGWQSLFFSYKDIQTGWSTGPDWKYYNNPVDRKAHGGLAFVPWYLQQFHNAEIIEGRRLLDVLDVHAYITPSGPSVTDALLLQSTRAFWDPNYVYESPWAGWVVDVDNKGAPVAPRLIPRLREWIDQYYPGTKLAITEYNWAPFEKIVGGLAQADILGIFGREGVDIGTIWGTGTGKNSDPPGYALPGGFAFRIFRNYDGAGGAFGDTSVQATTADCDKLSVFAAQRTADHVLTVLVINKTTDDLPSTVALNNFPAADSAQVWQYSQADLTKIQHVADAQVNANTISATFPAYSMTLFVVPLAQLAKPQISAVVSAASYTTPIAPGQIVTLFGTGLGPAALQSLVLDASGKVANTVAGTRVLFDGNAAPLVYVSAMQVSAIVPYAVSGSAASSVQVEYCGNGSDPFIATIAATAPSLFTAGSVGSGQAAALNQDGSVNSTLNPAARGSIVVLYLTGEGQTNPPGVDGQLASTTWPKPLADVSVQIGGFPATLEYAGAAPQAVAGLMQINARMSGNVAQGDKVPVQVNIGGVVSQPNVTIAVR